MADQPMTVAYLLDPSHEDDLRKLAGEVLNPPPWRHIANWDKSHDPKWHCGKCGIFCLGQDENDYRGDFGCPIPDPATGSLSDIAEQLVKKCIERKPSTDVPKWPGDNGGVSYGLFLLGLACIRYWRGPENKPLLSLPFESDHLCRWWTMTPNEKVACCLLALLPDKVRL